LMHWHAEVTDSDVRKPAIDRAFASFDRSAPRGRLAIQALEKTRFHFRSASQDEVDGFTVTIASRRVLARENGCPTFRNWRVGWKPCHVSRLRSLVGKASHRRPGSRLPHCLARLRREIAWAGAFASARSALEARSANMTPPSVLAVRVPDHLLQSVEITGQKY
jgi:hypothetical protein